MRRSDREVTDPGELEDIIRRAAVCHLAMVDGDTPYVVPLNFGYAFEEGVLTLYFHSARAGRKLDILRRNAQVCFEMAIEGGLLSNGDPCETGFAYASVIGTGLAELLEDPAAQCRALSLLMKQQTGRELVFTPAQAAAVCTFCVRAVEICGKRGPMPPHE